MKSNTPKTMKRILNAVVQNTIAREANKTVSCPAVWSYQPHRPTTPFLQTSNADLNQQGKA